ncbi:MAG: class I SAM-dependent methyltransferase [Acetobacteraceae bacterium]|nr:class I SAM-dependent methyltransferase [Acetobacteraceae bacterium]
MIRRLVRAVRRRDEGPAAAAPAALPPDAAPPQSASDLLVEINAEVPPGVDWRAGALRYVSAEFAKHGAEAMTRYLLSKPFVGVAAEGPGGGAQLVENVEYLLNFVNLIALLNLPGRSRVLDVACGSGWVSHFLARMNYETFGFDICHDMVELTKRRLREDPLLGPAGTQALDDRFFVLDAEREELPAPLRGTFDAIVMESCVHHFFDPVSALSNIAAGLKDDGIAVVIEGENRFGPIRPEYLAVMREFDTLERPYTRSQMERMLPLAGLRAFRFLGRVNGWFSPDDPQIPSLPEMVRGDADARNLAVCARTPVALARVLPRLRLG